MRLKRRWSKNNQRNLVGSRNDPEPNLPRFHSSVTIASFTIVSLTERLEQAKITRNTGADLLDTTSEWNSPHYMERGLYVHDKGFLHERPSLAEVSSS